MTTAPYDLVATAVSNSQINLSWTNGEANYNGGIDVYRDGAKIGDIGGTETSYSATGLSSATNYSFYVKAYRVTPFPEWEGDSNTISKTTLLNAPTGLGASAAGKTEIDLSWTNNDTYDNVYVEWSHGGWTTIATLSGGTTSYPVTGLSAGTTHTYRVCAKRNGVTTSYTGEATASTTLDPPASLTISSIGPNSHKLDWTNGDTYYTILINRKESGGSYSQIASITGTSVTYTDNSATANTTYYYKIKGHVDVDSSYSGEVSATGYSSSIAWSAVSTAFTGSYVQTAGVDLEWPVTVGWTPSYAGVFYTTGTWPVVTALTPRYALSAKQNYAYYLADDTGKVYLYDSAYKSDNGTTILCSWQSKETDYTDQNPAALNKRKTTYRCRLVYVDKTASTPIIVSVSKDGGITWTALYKTAGTGDGATKTAYFQPVVTGVNHVFKVESSSTSADFQWISLEADYVLGGEGF